MNPAAAVWLNPLGPFVHGTWNAEARVYTDALNENKICLIL